MKRMRKDPLPSFTAARCLSGGLKCLVGNVVWGWWIRQSDLDMHSRIWCWIGSVLWVMDWKIRNRHAWLYLMPDGKRFVSLWIGKWYIDMHDLVYSLSLAALDYLRERTGWGHPCQLCNPSTTHSRCLQDSTRVRRYCTGTANRFCISY